MTNEVDHRSVGKTSARYPELSEPALLGPAHDHTRAPDWMQTRLETFGRAATPAAKGPELPKTVVPTPAAFAGTPLAEAAAQKPQRVVAVALGGIIPGADAQAGYVGVEQKLSQLEHLAPSTKGTGVAILVQAVRTLDKDGRACHATDAPAGTEQRFNCDEAAWTDRRLSTERYLIYDGKMTKLDFKPTNAASDTAALVRDAALLAGGSSSEGKLNLILQSHGNADLGISTAAGKLDLPTLRGALSAGLQAGGRKQFDNIDFDSCLMGSVKVMQAMQGLTKTIDASSAPELAVGNQAGQNLQAILDFELHNPAASALDLSNHIVELAKSGANGDSNEPGTVTLASFDLAKLPYFQSALDQFGKNLAEAVANPSNLAAIRKAIDASGGMDTGSSPQFTQNRDLQKFANNLLSAIERGEIQDKQGQLKAATNAFLKSMSEFRPSFFGESSFGFGTVGGITASLPGSDILNPKVGAHGLSPLQEGIRSLDEILKHPPADAQAQFEQARFLGLSVYQAQTLLQSLKPGQLFAPPGKGDMPPELKRLWQLSNNLLESSKQSTPQEYAHAAAQLREALIAADKRNLGKLLEHKLEPKARKAREAYLRTAAFDLTPNWRRFIQRLVREH